MRFLPWRRQPETRAEASYTDLLTAQLEANASYPFPARLAAIEIASGLYARAFASCRVTPASSPVTPAMLAQAARSLILRGETVYAIDIRAGAVTLTPAGSWDIEGGPDPETWRYRLDLFGPSGNVKRELPAASVVHLTYATDPAQPWHGRGPWYYSSETVQLASWLERRLREEARASVGQLLPVPDSIPDDAEQALRRDLAALEGRVALVPSTSAGWGDGKQAAPLSDWQARRMGANPPATLGTLRGDSGTDLLAAAGVPPSLALGNADGTAQREAWRRFLHGAVSPLANLVAAELRAKLDTPALALDFGELHASDVMGRARAYGSLVKGGMPPRLAAELAGFGEHPELPDTPPEPPPEPPEGGIGGGE